MENHEFNAVNAPSERIKQVVKGWMGRIDGSKKINEISIPGTHDSGAEWGGTAAETQSWSIREQLEAGIRYFDIRLKPDPDNPDNLAVYHGVFPQYRECKIKDEFGICYGGTRLTLKTILADMDYFLKQNPTEAIIMRTYYEGSSDYTSEQKEDWTNRFKNILWEDTNGKEGIQYTDRLRYPVWNVKQPGTATFSTTIPRLNDLRGKLWIHRTGGNEDDIPLFQYANGNIETQNNYSESVNVLSAAAVKHLRDAPDLIASGNWVHNWTNGLNLTVAAAPVPHDVASYLNRDVFFALNDVPSQTPVGTVVMDFPGEGLIYRIIKTNFDYEREVDLTVAFDCNINWIAGGATSNKITVQLYNGPELIGTQTQVPGCNGLGDSFFQFKKVMPAMPQLYTHIRVSTDNVDPDDGFGIDEMYISNTRYGIHCYNGGIEDDVLEKWGVDGGQLWCLSTPESNEFGGYANGCNDCLTFVTGQTTTAKVTCQTPYGVQTQIDQYELLNTPIFQQKYDPAVTLSPPVARCKPLVVQLDEYGQAVIDPAQLNNGSYNPNDPNAPLHFSASQKVFDCDDLRKPFGQVWVELFVSNGTATSSCQTYVIVEPGPMPAAINTRDQTVKLRHGGTVTVDPGDVYAGPELPCYLEMQVFPSTFTCEDVGDNEVLLHVYNPRTSESAYSEATVTVVDDIDPFVFFNYPGEVKLGPDGTASLDASTLGSRSYDDCSEVTLEIKPKSTFDCDDLGTMMVTLYATDASGNRGYAYQNITIVDDLPPQVVTKSTVVYLDEAGAARIFADDVDGGSTDNCGIADRWVSPSTFDCRDVGEQVVTLYVADGSENLARQTAIVTVVDPSGREGEQTFYADVDQDGYGDAAATLTACTAPAGYVALPGDCDDSDALAYPGQRWYLDRDHDGYPESSTIDCARPAHGFAVSELTSTETDNCPDAFNPDQSDSNGDGVGDACDTTGGGDTLSAYWLEAECGIVGGQWRVTADANASNQAFVYAPGRRSTAQPPADVPENRIRFTLDRAAAGSYFLHIRAYTRNRGEDSFWVRVNGGSWIQWNNIDCNRKFSWATLPTPLELLAGSNTFDVAFREGGAILDKLYLARETARPGGFGEPATNCEALTSQPPTAIARASTTHGSAPLAVELDGRLSYDFDGFIVDYAWSWPGGSATGPNPTATFAPGTHKVLLKVTDNDGESNTTSLTILATEPADLPTTLPLSFEAECTFRDRDWRLSASSEASGDRFVSYTGCHCIDEPTPQQADRHLNFDFRTTETDTFYLFLRLDAPDGGRNSFWVRVDDGKWIKMWREADGRQLLTTGFEWRQVNDDTRPVAFVLSPGEHTITVAPREPGTKLDKLILSPDEVLPLGTGAPAQNCPAAAALALKGAAMEEVLPYDDALFAAPELVVYPNPVTDHVTVELADGYQGEVVLQVADALGRQVRQQRLRKEDRLLRTDLSVSDLPPGLYHLLLQQSECQLVERFVKQ
ncbi:hypothetical protein GGR26_003259 [Lewinella marina]|uniref:1-phosphatidylinositol phosphodiesterase n=2 Tax=Neolewinella marina TaxID=438751 RepID=A0A2G0CE12_9BACT|nr:T9SS type A sorting domain-containing protein [Neolewinella marina]NJB87479.1 hypothetical protein [Neolewinella marina]PHK98213.1 hypothetical protein CGL56_10945 [Neolewinella marina]